MENLKTKTKETNVKMGEILKEVRNGKKVTMRALANKLERPHSFIGKTEQQSRRLDVGEFIQYCIALDADPVEIFNKLV